MPTAEDLVELTSEQGADVEDKRESYQDAVMRIYRDLLEHPEKADPDKLIRASMAMAQQRIQTQGEEAADRYAGRLAETMAIGFWDLMDIPISARDDVWRDALASVDAAAMQQAMVEAGLAVELVEGGVDAELRATPIAHAIGEKGLREASKLGKLKRIKEKRKQRKATRIWREAND